MKQLILIASLWGLLGSGIAAEPARKYVGSIAEIKGQVELREAPNRQPIRLNPTNDLYRPVYLGDQVSCKTNGEITVYLLFGHVLKTNATDWVTIPEVSPQDANRTAPLREYQETKTLPAGRVRGNGPARRALLVGINIYRIGGGLLPGEATGKVVASNGTTAGAKQVMRGSWTDLDGCLNDVASMRELLIARFGFPNDDILVLTNAQATREGIMTAFRRQLIEPSQPGDVAFFFYAGHGSQVTNSKSDEEDKKDETLVPADSSSGAPDIRDKELRRLFNAVLSRRATVTAIFDSCHSGSITRGYPLFAKSRSLPADPRDVADDSDPGPNPKMRGALVISAALPTQSADEQKDAEGTPHGALSMALFRVLRSADLYETTERLFLRVKAALQTEGRLQEPILDGEPDRLRKNLFGDLPGRLPDRMSAAVLRVASDREVELQGGLAIGLSPKCELQKVIAGGQGPPARVRVTSVEGLTRAKAEVIEGAAKDIQAGDLFEVATWAAPDETILRVWIPPAFAIPATLQNIGPALQELRRSARFDWVEDPTHVSPTHIISWDGAYWVLGTNGQGSRLGKTLDAKSVLKRLTDENGGGQRARLFVQLPPSAQLKNGIQLGHGITNSAIEVTKSVHNAHYLLIGRMAGGHPQYAWVAPNLTTNDAMNTPMPLRTDWCIADDEVESVKNAAAELRRSAAKLGRIRAWLQLPSPPDGGRFPYRLVLSNTRSHAIKTDGEVVKGGEQYELLLHADPERVKDGIFPRYVYVFILDSFGKSSLLFPQTGGNDENRLPLRVDGVAASPSEIRLKTPSPVTILAPFGVDTYILLSTDQALPNPSVLDSEGVRTRGSSSPLETLLDAVGSATRGAGIVTPMDWSIERLPIRSEPAPE